MSDLAEFLRVPAVRFVRRLPGRVDKIFAIVSDPKIWGEGTLERRAGGAVNLMGGHIRGVVTHWDPPRKLTYTWNVFSPGEMRSAYPESYLTLELAAIDGETELTLTHLPVLERFEKQNAMGWHVFLAMIADAAHGRAPAPRSDYAKRIAPLYGIDLGNLVR
jgi:uncharacterized protein YndB with AHSA1/START domain